jgi:hypothetical protein
MNIKHLPTRIEVSLWQFAVAILTYSRFFQTLVKWSYPYLVKIGAFKGASNYLELED